MEIIGRLTADAKVNELKDGRQVVNFSIATNDYYKVKDSDEVKKVTTYFNCSYWINSSVAKALTKGTLVQLYGRIGVNTYINSQDETKASLTFHTNNIKLHGKPSAEKKEQTLIVVKSMNEDAGDDLPF
jgi:single-strand DNA-binding protein